MPKLQIQEQVPLAPYTSIGVGGSARFFAQVRSEEELEQALAFQKQNALPLGVLGGGSNLLVRDEGFAGLVIHLAIEGAIASSEDVENVRYDVPAGIIWDDFVLLTCRRGLNGVACLAGIPGMTGGTPVQNVGAYGQEVSQTIESIRTYDRRYGRFTDLTAEECLFGYRTSLLNSSERGRFLVTHVRFKLSKGAASPLSYAELRDRFQHQSDVSALQIYDAVREIRRAKGMLLSPEDPDSRSAGSFFKNPIISASLFRALPRSQPPGRAIPNWPAEPGSNGESRVKIPAAWLVENAGFAKGFQAGKVGISSRHTLAIVNRGGATFADVTALRDRIREAVAGAFQIILEQEPVELSEHPDMLLQRTASSPTFGSLD